ncbi:hypothetical protein OsI_15349 [Oryza sativa Indica Group]|uniref:DUF4283 domain-containing protein n=1 Tax=Oryza sativa subsp. indica TaxID=39946 RepID=B8AS90_ORYSI|nr:hypothetical protein OsI_15349 [Oryza sativa Indica Group]
MEEEQETNQVPLPDPEITTSLEAMTITPRKEIRVKLQQSPETASVQGFHNLLMKVGYSGGQQRQIPLEALRKSMAKAWQKVYLDISQVENNLFMAHFRTYDDLSWVWQKQPWSFGSEVFLFEWVSLDDKIKPMSAYTFKHLMVNVRIYGIPSSLKNVENVRLAAGVIGQISKAEPIDEDSLHKNDKFVSVRIRQHFSSPQHKNIQGQEKHLELACGAKQKHTLPRLSQNPLTLREPSTEKRSQSLGVHTIRVDTVHKEKEKGDQQFKEAAEKRAVSETQVHGSTVQKKLTFGVPQEHVSQNPENVGTVRLMRQTGTNRFTRTIQHSTPSITMHHSNRTGSTNYNKEMHGKTNPKSSAFMNQDKLSELPDLHLNKKRALDESILGGNEHGGITSQGKPTVSDHSTVSRNASKRSGSRASRWDQGGSFGGGVANPIPWGTAVVAFEGANQGDPPKSTESAHSDHRRQHPWNNLEKMHNAIVAQDVGVDERSNLEVGGSKSHLSTGMDNKAGRTDSYVPNQLSSVGKQVVCTGTYLDSKNHGKWGPNKDDADDSITGDNRHGGGAYTVGAMAPALKAPQAS